MLVVVTKVDYDWMVPFNLGITCNHVCNHNGYFVIIATWGYGFVVYNGTYFLTKKKKNRCD